MSLSVHKGFCEETFNEGTGADAVNLNLLEENDAGLLE
jgi:hypothetical protein